MKEAPNEPQAMGRNRHRGANGVGSFADLSARQNDPSVRNASPVRDEKTIQQRLEQLRGQLLQWGTPDLHVFVITKDELRGWIRALEWILGKREPTFYSSAWAQGAHCRN